MLLLAGVIFQKLLESFRFFINIFKISKLVNEEQKISAFYKRSFYKGAVCHLQFNLRV